MKNANFECVRVGRGYGSDTYRFENAGGMTEAEIINACDCCNFGGYVYGNTCVVYTD